jgi:Flp pilus assembly pilin Flp
MKGHLRISKAQTVFRHATACLLITLMPAFALAQAGASTTTSVTQFNTSFNVGPVAVSLQMTNPIQAQSGVVWDTLHIEARDDTQSPALHATIDAVGQAADAATLLGGFLPAAIIIQNDLKAGLTLAQGIADAQTKTGVTITSFHDGLTEYALILALIAILVIAALKTASPTLSPQMSAILSKMQTSLAAVGGSDLSTLLSDTQTSLTTVQGGSVIP